jgi:hypothetical protein
MSCGDTVGTWKREKKSQVSLAIAVGDGDLHWIIKI